MAIDRLRAIEERLAAIEAGMARLIEELVARPKRKARRERRESLAFSKLVMAGAAERRERLASAAR